MESLKSQLDRLSGRSQIKEVNIEAQEAIIRVLQQRYDAEKQGRAKAQWALTDRAQALDNCLTQQRALEKEAVTCQEELSALNRA